MIVLDTNVIAEAMRNTPNERVLGWLTAQSGGTLFTTALTQAEIFYGLNLLPAGRRRAELTRAAHPMFETEFAGRVLAFDSEAAMTYAEIAAARRRSGQPISPIDGQIAGIVRSRGASLATRNTRDFSDCGIVVIDPWREG